MIMKKNISKSIKFYHEYINSCYVKGDDTLDYMFLVFPNIVSRKDRTTIARNNEQLGFVGTQFYSHEGQDIMVATETEI